MRKSFNEIVIINVYANCYDKFQLNGLKSIIRVANWFQIL